MEHDIAYSPRSFLQVAEANEKNLFGVSGIYKGNSNSEKGILILKLKEILTQLMDIDDFTTLVEFGLCIASREPAARIACK
ncbi:hypothetical protein TNIN_369711 [Trichonephila inaurata madagascariensis]|uniref:Uncharacterized protein n=1 Tax=Trichonephila inaurata madagascariensis TaxID=2747483 RepID=A0A8X7CIQ5_9ARAC|nr:hypothetical protein TNIN_369711 [Trichonephila inaurata madagascariensis]